MVITTVVIIVITEIIITIKETLDNSNYFSWDSIHIFFTLVTITMLILLVVSAIMNFAIIV